MLVNSDVDADARVQREARSLVRAGHRVTIIALAGSDDGYEVIPVGAAATVPRVPAAAHPAVARARATARWLLLPSVMERQRAAFVRAARGVALGLKPPGVVHAHDYETLGLGAELADRWDVPLVYDSHELWAHRVRHGRPTPAKRRRDRLIEQRLGARADAVITVGEEIAGWMQHELGWDHVHVVRNSFPDSGLPPLDGPPSGLLYAGRIAQRRDLETVAAAAPDLPLPVVVMGPGDARLLDRLRLVDNVEVYPAVPVGEVVDAIRAHGIALVTAADGPLSYRWSMPNKLFQAVQAGAPVVATDLPAQARVVREHDLGTVYRAGDAQSMIAAVHRVVADYDRLRYAVSEARAALSWATDERVLLDVHAQLHH